MEEEEQGSQTVDIPRGRRGTCIEREGREREREEHSTDSPRSRNSVGGGIHNFASCHSVSRRAFSSHSSCTPCGTYERLFARSHDATATRRWRSCTRRFILFRPPLKRNAALQFEECTSRRNTDAFLKLAVLSYRSYIDADLRSNLHIFSDRFAKFPITITLAYSFHDVFICHNEAR